jgi:phosphopantothenoylcysteine decarboxylase/phosphopantothenate--cysteine ligase
MRFLIASGPTQEPLDPVRYLSNYSTGTMGKYLAEAAKKRGHVVRWVRCPDDAGTALDLQKKLNVYFPKSDVLVMAAAVCDVRPAAAASAKIHKEGLRSLKLVKNPDILAGLSRRKGRGQICVGFGLESGDLGKSGLRKLKEKNLELIILQKVTSKIRPFGDRKVRAEALYKSGRKVRLGLIDKKELSSFVICEAEKLKILSAARN